MSYAAETGTLGFHATSPYVRRVNVADVPLGAVVPALKAFKDAQSKLPVADVSAAEFYLWQHAVGEVRATALPNAPLSPADSELLATYAERLASDLAPRMFYYLVLICLRESRHAHRSADELAKMLAKEDEADLSGAAETLISFWARGNSEDGAMARLFSAPPPVTLGVFSRWLIWMFENGKYSNGYGGPKWAEVARCLNRFVQGETSAEIMLDTAYTLCHNNGPIFNKHMLFAMYTPKLTELLDVQRAGMIPHYIAEGRVSVPGFHRIAALRGWNVSAMYVDWYRVEALGAVQKYLPYKQAQVAKYGLPPGVKGEEVEEVKESKPAKKPDLFAELEKAAVPDGPKFSVKGLHTEVPIVKRGDA